MHVKDDVRYYGPGRKVEGIVDTIVTTQEAPQLLPEQRGFFEIPADESVLPANPS